MQLELLKLCVAGVPSRSVADLTGEVLVEECYFGGRRNGKRGSGAAGTVPVFGLLKRGGFVHTVMINDAKLLTLIGIIRQRIETDSIVYTDSFRSYDVLDVSEFHHYRINYKEKFGSERSHINGIKNFWNQPNGTWLLIMASRRATCFCSSRNANAALITAQPAIS